MKLDFITSRGSLREVSRYLFAAEQVMRLKLEYRVVQITARVVSVHLRNVAGIAHAQTQFAGNLVTQAAHVAK